MPIDLAHFVSKWNSSNYNEETAAHDHFRDLCEALDVPHPLQTDEIGASYTYEKRVKKAGSNETGFADVWKRGFFAWEYKSKGGDLRKAYRQLTEYHEALDNPPLLVVCDFVRFEVHTKFENQPSRVYSFILDDLLKPSDTATCALPPLEVLRHCFQDPNQLRPGVAAARVTRLAAGDISRLAERLEIERALTPTPPTREQIAHFLMRIVFCLFADSVKILPERTFSRLINNNRASAMTFNRMLPGLFQAMSEEDGIFGTDAIPYFNGGLFSDSTTIPLDYADLGILKSATQHDWSYVEPSIFGTLFERSLDSRKRSKIGAHYTSPEDILLLIEPVIVQPLQRRWAAVQQRILEALAAEPPLNKDGQLAARLRTNRPALTLLQDWASELCRVRVLDPACGSGNFLYIALKRLLDLWDDARLFGIAHGLTLNPEPIPNPTQLFGIEIDFYAHEIASVVVWIGWLQWKHDHGVKETTSPLLQKLTNIERGDAILRYDEQGKPYEPTWPEAEYIVGNPPFLGDKLMRRALDGESHPSYTTDLRALYFDRVPGGADLVTYWFEKARAAVASQENVRAGLLATQGIRGGKNRLVLERIVACGQIFWARADREWTLNGAAVHVSLIAFDNGNELQLVLDGENVPRISSALTAGTDVTVAQTLLENSRLAYIGDMKKGSFDIDVELATKMLNTSGNPNGLPNDLVIKPFLNARDITGRLRQTWIIDFGEMDEIKSAQFEAPFEYLLKHEKPHRDQVRNLLERTRWWQHGRVAKDLRLATVGLSKLIATPRVSKHRIFCWIPSDVVPDGALVIFAREDDYFIGMLHSSTHEVWSRSQGTQLREVESGFRYTPKTTFDTFPFPWPPGTEPSEADSPIVRAIAEAARELVRLRDAWLNPPGIPEEDLKKRTLTNLYNQRPTWLSNAHRTLDEAVFAAYGWPADLSTQQILANLLALNHERAAAQPPKPKPRRPKKNNHP